MKLRNFVGKRVSKEVDFMQERILIFKLSVDDVMMLQKASKDAIVKPPIYPPDATDEVRAKILADWAEAQDAKGTESFTLLYTTIRKGADGGEELTDEDFKQLPLEELASLSEAIMSFSGVGNDEKKK